MPIKEVLSVEEVTSGSVLKRLIDEADDLKNQKDFVAKFNDWLADHHPDAPAVTEKDVSRWTTGRVSPRKNKLLLFAEYFNVPMECFKGEAEVRKRKIRHVTDEKWLQLADASIPESIKADLKRYRRFNALMKYCEDLGYKIEERVTSGQETTFEVEITEGGKLYHLQITDNKEADGITVVFPDGTKFNPTDEQLETLLNNVDHAVEYEFYNLKTKKGVKTNGKDK